MRTIPRQSLFIDIHFYLSHPRRSFMRLLSRVASWMTQEINKFFNNIFYAWAIKQKSNRVFIAARMRKIAFDWHGEFCSTSPSYDLIEKLQQIVWQSGSQRFVIHVWEAINQICCFRFAPAHKENTLVLLVVSSGIDGVIERLEV